MLPRPSRSPAAAVDLDVVTGMREGLDDDPRTIPFPGGGRGMVLILDEHMHAHCELTERTGARSIRPFAPAPGDPHAALAMLSQPDSQSTVTR